MSVKIDHTALSTAIEELTSLASAVESRRNAVIGGTPIALPSLSGGSLTRTTAWLEEQQPLLQGLHDIALLLAEKGSTVASFTVGTRIQDVQELLGETLADQAGMANPNFPEDQEKYLEIFANWQFDPATMAAFHHSLGPEGTLRMLSMWAEAPANRPIGEMPSEIQADLVAAMKRSLVTANQDGGFTRAESEAFAHGLVEAATIPVEDYYGRGPYNPSGALNYLLHDSRFNDTFIKTIAEDLDQYERQDSNGAGQDLWSQRPDQGVRFGDYLPWGSTNPYEGNSDPMTGLMSAMSHNPRVALEFFSDNDDDGQAGGEPSRAYYYLHERDWDHDSFDGITQVINAATTDDSIIRGSAADQRDAALLASKTVHYLSGRDDFEDVTEALHRWPENGAAEDLAHVLSTYMPAVEDGIGRDMQDGDHPDAGSFPVDSMGGRPTADMPVFFREDLSKFMLMATATDQGLGELTQGINEWRGQNLGALADTYRDAHDRAGATDANDPVLSVNQAQAALREGIQNDARLQGFLLAVMGDDAVHDAAAQDKRTRATIGMFSDIADLVPVPGAGRLAEGVTKDAILAGVEHARGEGFDRLEDALAHAEQDAVTDWNDQAGATLDREHFVVASLLDSRGLAADPDAMSSTARPGGQLITYDEYVQLDSSDRRAVEEELFGTAHGVGTVLNQEDYADAYRSMFHDYFEKGQQPDE